MHCLGHFGRRLCFYGIYSIGPNLNRLVEVNSANGILTARSRDASAQHNGTPNRNESEPEADVKLILLTYMRSGSTFTGDLFNLHTKVFYFYEPLWAIDFRFQRQKEEAIFFHQKSMKYGTGKGDAKAVTDLMYNVLKSTLACDFTHIYIRPLLLPMTFIKSRSMQPFQTCTNDNPGYYGLYSCLPLLNRACAEAKVVALKTVRLPMAMASTLLEADPKVKVIHLLRDPRGVLHSRGTSGIAALYHVTPKEFCDYVTKDMKDSIELKTRYPGRVLTARYEDLAQRPLAFSAQLLTFAGLDMTPRLQQLILNMTSSKNVTKEATFETQRSDSSRTASLWRNDVKFSFVQSADNSCAEYYRLTGYLPFESEKDLRNLTKPFYKDYKEVPLTFWSN